MSNPIINPGSYRSSYNVTEIGVTLTNFGTIGGGGVTSFTYAAGVVNYGTISGNPRSGIYLEGGGSVTNDAGGTISGATALYAAAATTVTNEGAIIGGNSYGIQITAGGMVDNQSGGFITGREAIQITRAAGTLANYGTILGNGSYGIQVADGGAVTNHAGGTISGYDGIWINNGGIVVNAAEVFATEPNGSGILLVDGGSVTNSVHGAISGSRGVGVLNAAGSVVNAGSITGTVGIYLKDGGSVIDQSSGTISGMTDAVKFGAGYASRMVIYPQAVLSGTVYGGNQVGATAVSTLELASAAGIGTLSGLGSQYVDFAQTTIDSGAQWVLTGANVLTAGYSITNAGTLTLSDATFSDGGVVTNNGVIVLDPSTMTVASLLGSGTVTIAAGSTLEVTGSIASGETIVFAGGESELHLDDPAEVQGSVTGFGAYDTIDLQGVDPGSVVDSGGTVSFAGGSFPLAGVAPIVATSADGTSLTALCFCTDTLIETPAGRMKVQDLRAGDLVMTVGGTARPITWIGTGAVLATRGRRNAATPVIVRKHALGHNMPFYDLRVTKGHSLLIDGVLIPVEFLVNHRTIEWDDRAAEVRLYHIELETHDILIANGAPAESYRDDGNRWLFQNANTGWDQPAKVPYAPVLTGGPVVDAAWRRLLDRAGARPGLPLTADPDLHLLVDGHRLDATSRHGDVRTFRLMGQPESIRLVSRSAAPQELGLARDPRTLGVAVRRLVLCQGARLRLLDAEDASLAEGFHGFEPDNGFRWTNGNAALPAALFAGLHGHADLEVHVGAWARYVAEAESAAA
jgi:hypothetical protein